MVDVAGAHVAVELSVASTEAVVVHVRGEVIHVHLSVAVDIAWDENFRAGKAEDVELSAGAEVAASARHLHAQIAHAGATLEGHLLCLGIGGPAERHGLAPRPSVKAIADGALLKGAVAGVLARQVEQLVKLDGAAEVDVHGEGHGLLAPCRMPNGGLIEIEEVPDTLATLVGTRRRALDAVDGKLQRVGIGGGAERSPLRGAVGVDATNLEVVLRLGLQFLKEKLPFAKRGVAHTVEHDFRVVGILGQRPRRLNGIGCRGVCSLGGFQRAMLLGKLHHRGQRETFADNIQSLLSHIHRWNVYG